MVKYVVTMMRKKEPLHSSLSFICLFVSAAIYLILFLPCFHLSNLFALLLGCFYLKILLTFVNSRNYILVKIF